MTAFLAKFYEAVIIALTAFLLLVVIGLSIQSWRVSHYQSEYKLLDAKFKIEVAEANAATEKAIADAAVKEKMMAQKLLDAERNYNVQIEKITADARAADLAADSLSKQLDTAKSHVPTATTKTVIEYIDTSSDILKHCIAEYRIVAKAADEHAADVERLSDGWPE